MPSSEKTRFRILNCHYNATTVSNTARDLANETLAEDAEEILRITMPLCQTQQRTSQTRQANRLQRKRYNATVSNTANNLANERLEKAVEEQYNTVDENGITQTNKKVQRNDEVAKVLGGENVLGPQCECVGRFASQHDHGVY